MGKKREKEPALSGKDDFIEMKAQLEAPEYRTVCEYAIQVVELKLHMIKESMESQYGRAVVSSMTERIKTAESIRRKLEKKRLPIDFQTAQSSLNDLVGVRVTCFFEDDIYELVKRISSHADISVVKKKDYIRKPKTSGYHSFHLIVDVPVYGEGCCRQRRVELQFRTVAMDFWAQLDYQLCYKREMKEEERKKLQEKLADYAGAICEMDKNMMKLRRQIEGM